MKIWKRMTRIVLRACFIFFFSDNVFFLRTSIAKTFLHQRSALILLFIYFPSSSSFSCISFSHRCVSRSGFDWFDYRFEEKSEQLKKCRGKPSSSEWPDQAWCNRRIEEIRRVRICRRGKKRDKNLFHKNCRYWLNMYASRIFAWLLKDAFQYKIKI